MDQVFSHGSSGRTLEEPKLKNRWIIETGEKKNEAKRRRRRKKNKGEREGEGKGKGEEEEERKGGRYIQKRKREDEIEIELRTDLLNRCFQRWFESESSLEQSRRRMD